MVHVNVGTGNTINNVTNAARDRAPLILAAGRTPFTEKGSFGSRSRSIHWAQEMFDQAGMLREMVKWDYELKVPEQAADVAARAYEMTMTSPRGPVYLVLPREPLSAPVSETLSSAPRAVAGSSGHPDPQAIETLAEWIAKAQSPLIITSSDGDPRAVAALAKLAERLRAAGGQSQSARGDAAVQPPDACRLRFRPAGPGGRSHHQRRMRRAVVSAFRHAEERLQGRAYRRGPGLSALSDAFVSERSVARVALGRRLRGAARCAGEASARRWPPRSTGAASRPPNAARSRDEKADKEARGASDKITPAYLSRCIGEAFGTDAVIFNEYPLSLEHCPRDKAESFYSLGPAGGLGWGLGAAIGAKLAAPEKLIVATLGDGSYMFGNPTVEPLGAAEVQPADPVDRVQQQPLWRGAQGHAVDVQGRRRRRDRWPLPRRSRPVAALRRIRDGAGRTWRARRAPRGCAGARWRAPATPYESRKQALLNVITPY